MSLKHALLAMIDIDTGTGYDLAKRFDQSVGFFWPSSFQQVYRDLANMERAGLVSGERVNQVGKPDKKIYAVTPAGIKELEKWLELPARDMKIKDTFLIKLFGGHRIPKQQLLEDLYQQRKQHQSSLSHYSELAEGLKSQGDQHFQKYFLPYQALQLGIRFEKTWLDWSHELEANLLDYEGTDKTR